MRTPWTQSLDSCWTHLPLDDMFEHEHAIIFEFNASDNDVGYKAPLIRLRATVNDLYIIYIYIYITK